MAIIIKKRNAAIQDLKYLFDNMNQTYIIHYSCESFVGKEDGKTPRVVTIVLRNLKSAQTISFSLHLEAELKGIDIDKIEEHYDELEKSMLDKFFKHIEPYQNCNFLHWNMRDHNYGFRAIEQRYQVLKGKPVIIQDTQKYDLSRILIDIYGKSYIGHPRLEKLVEKNKIKNLGFLSGRDEADAFDNKHFLKLHKSTLSKSDVLANIAQLAYEGNLKNLSSRKDVLGGYFCLFKDVIVNHWIVAFIGLIGAVLGIYSYFSLL